MKSCISTIASFALDTVNEMFVLAFLTWTLIPCILSSRADIIGLENYVDGFRSIPSWEVDLQEKGYLIFLKPYKLRGDRKQISYY